MDDKSEYAESNRLINFHHYHQPFLNKQLQRKTNSNYDTYHHLYMLSLLWLVYDDCIDTSVESLYYHQFILICSFRYDCLIQDKVVGKCITQSKGKA